MAFPDTFRRTAPGAEEWGTVSRWMPAPVQSGVYEHGLVAITDEGFGLDWAVSWPASRYAGLTPIAYTALGDVFFVEERTGEAHILDVQYQELSRAAPDCRTLLESVLMKPKVLDQILRRGLLQDLVARLGPLEYLECFILVPWLMLGGSDRPENYSKGDVRTYLNLVGQTAFRSRE